MAQTPSPSVLAQTPAVNAPASKVPFRAATLERIDILAAESQALTTATQRIERTVEGAGYVYSVLLDVNATSATSTAASVAVAAEDYPFNVLDSVIFRDPNAELVNLQGFNLAVAQVANGWSKTIPSFGLALGAGQTASGVGGTGTSSSQDANTTLNVGAVGTASTGTSAGGNFRFQLEVPVGVCRRNLLGIVGNQDRAVKYSLRTDIAASGQVFGTSPSSLPTIAINKFYNEYSVPLPNAPDGSPQDIMPDNFGTLSFLTQSVSEAAPSNGSTINHYLRRVGSSIRWVSLIVRSTTVASGTATRGNADANPPTLLRIKLGEDATIAESWTARRYLMFQRYGHDLFEGVLVYDFIHDFGPFSGFEIGDDIIHSQALVNAQFQITYPATASTWKGGSTATFVTSDLIYSQPQVMKVA